MAFKLKSVNKLLGLHETSNKLDNVIKEVDMPDPRIFGYIDENKTIFVNKDLRYKQKVKTIAHEKGHKKQMEEGRLKFDSNFYYWTPNKGGATFKMPTRSIDTRSRQPPWEYEIERKIKRKR